MRQLLGFMLLMAAAAIGVTRYMDHYAKSRSAAPTPAHRCTHPHPTRSPAAPGGPNARPTPARPAPAPARGAGAASGAVTRGERGRGVWGVEARIEGRRID